MGKGRASDVVIHRTLRCEYRSERYKLDLNMYPSTKMAVLNDLVEVLNRQGIYELLILNSHGGNDFKTLLGELGAKYPKMWIATCSWFKILNHSTYL